MLAVIVLDLPTKGHAHRNRSPRPVEPFALVKNGSFIIEKKSVTNLSLFCHGDVDVVTNWFMTMSSCRCVLDMYVLNNFLRNIYI